MMTQVNLQELARQANYAAQVARQAQTALAQVNADHAALKQELQKQQQGNEALRNALSRVEIQKQGGDPHIQRIENIPGVRVPFDLLVDIAIAAGSTSVVQGSVTIPQDGPFVAVARYATLLSSYAFSVTPVGGGTAASFRGRSYGRYRPVSSVWDLGDSVRANQVAQVGLAFPGTGAPYIVSPANASPFRSMEGDFRIRFEATGSGFPRSNLEVPSPFWSHAINEPFALGALDFFERGSVLQWRVAPTHENNPQYGNLSGFSANPNYPFLDSGFDAVEGIDDSIQELGSQTTDPVIRVANAVLTIGMHGYIVRQPAGAGQY